MDHQRIPIRIEADGHVADRCFQRFKAERASVFFEPAMAAAKSSTSSETDPPPGEAFQFCAPFPMPSLFDPISYSMNPLAEKPRFFEPQHALIKPARPLKVCDRIAGTCDVRDFHAIPS